MLTPRPRVAAEPSRQRLETLASGRPFPIQTRLPSIDHTPRTKPHRLSPCSKTSLLQPYPRGTSLHGAGPKPKTMCGQARRTFATDSQDRPTHQDASHEASHRINPTQPSRTQPGTKHPAQPRRITPNTRTGQPDRVSLHDVKISHDAAPPSRIRPPSIPSGQTAPNPSAPQPQQGKRLIHVRQWWSLTGSNRRHPACKAGALPAELRPLPVRRTGRDQPPSSTTQTGSARRSVEKPVRSPAPEVPQARPGAAADAASQGTGRSRRRLRRPKSQSSGSPKRPRRMVGLGRLELPTSRLSSARSNQLSYKPKRFA